MAKFDDDKAALKATLNLPKTDFPMKADLPRREPERLGAWEKNDLESAIIASLPGNTTNYTAIVRGVNGTTGIAVVEVFALP